MTTAEYRRPAISLSELYDMKKKKETHRTRSFDHVMGLCHRRIRNIASYGGMNCFYEIPGVLLGYPLYRLDECTEYVVDKLRGTGFLVQLLPPPQIGVIYISWDPQEIKPKRAPPRPAITGPQAPEARPRRPRDQIVHTEPVLKTTNPLKNRFRIF